MTEQRADSLLRLAELADKVAMELVFAEAGKDHGLLPINDLLGQMAGLDPLPSDLSHGIGTARQVIDEVFDRTGHFNDEALRWFEAWTRWVQSSVVAARAGEPIAPPPAATTPTPSRQPARIVPQEPAAPASEASPLLNLESDGELLREFVQESREHLQDIELRVLALEDNPTDANTLNALFRAFHTFKGGSGFLNLGPISKLAHELESLLDLARQHKLRIDSAVTNLILVGRDTLHQFLDALERQLNGQDPAAPIAVPLRAVMAQIKQLTDGAGAANDIPAAHFDRPIPGDTPDPRVAGADAARPSTNPVEQSDRPSAEARSMGAATVKVDTQKLDSLVDLVGEMVIAQSMVSQAADTRAVPNQQLARNLAQLGRITKELQRVAMSLRMVPIRSTFQRMIRLVRDLAAKSGKQVELNMSGEDTEVDRTIAEEISDPLVHMIRNAIDHGLERSAARIAAGKPAQGHIGLRAFHQGGNIVIEVTDDGAGLNKDRILAKAIEKGIVGRDQALSDADAFKLIFMAGFSTAQTVTDISGRGVGMDVVRRNIEKLRGKIEIQSEAGRGCKFTIFLPLTLAIIDGFLVGVGSQRYVLPTLSVRASFRPTADLLSTVYERGELVRVRGQLVPLLRLHEHFGVQPQSVDPTQSIVVVIESHNVQRCLMVDQLLGKQEVVIKSLAEGMHHSAAVAGATILGDGRVGLILDAGALVKTGSALAKAA
ncbi:MAG: chemotaxis protein CheA [Verrucomicrobiota bacterium]